METSEVLDIEIKEEVEDTNYCHNECYMCGSDLTKFHHNNGKCKECTQLMDSFFATTKKPKKVKEKPKAVPANRQIKLIKKPFECDECKISFTLQTSLNAHKLRLHSDLRPYKCPKCPKTFKINGDLIMHSNVHSERSHFCQLCDKSFRMKQTLRSHVAHIHSNGNHPHPCGMCSKKFKTTASLNYHLKKDHLNERTYKCKFCPRAFVLTTELKRHLLSHSNKRLFQCEICPKKFKTKVDVRKHQKIVHEKLKPFKCEECSLQFADSAKLNRHMGIHNGIELKCKICSRLYRTEEDLKYHMKAFHDEKYMKSFPCNSCDKTFRSLRDRKKHLVVHITDRPFKCNQCNKSFKREDILKNHVVLVHDKTTRYYCKLCGKGFFLQSYLQTHLISAHTSTKNHICQICYIPLRSKGILNQHMKGHRGEMAFKCYFCSRRFYTMTPLEDHLRGHTEEKLMCPLCDKTFTIPRSRRLHMKIHEGTKKMYNCYFCDKSSPNAGYRNIHMRIHLNEQPEKCLTCGERFYTLDRLRRHHKKGCITGR